MVTMGGRLMKPPSEQEFELFLQEIEPRLRRAHFAALGIDRGREATAEALAWAWEHWNRLSRIKNPGGVSELGSPERGSSKLPPSSCDRDWHEPWIEPALGQALAQLSEQQRLAVVLVDAFDWTMREVGKLTGTKVPTVQTHLNRGLARLRPILGGR